MGRARGREVADRWLEAEVSEFTARARPTATQMHSTVPHYQRTWGSARSRTELSGRFGFWLMFRKLVWKVVCVMFPWRPRILKLNADDQLNPGPQIG